MTYANNQDDMFKQLSNKANRMNKNLGSYYYNNIVANIKTSNPGK